MSRGEFVPTKYLPTSPMSELEPHSLAKVSVLDSTFHSTRWSLARTRHSALTRNRPLTRHPAQTRNRSFPSQVTTWDLHNRMQHTLPSIHHNLRSRLSHHQGPKYHIYIFLNRTGLPHPLDTSAGLWLLESTILPGSSVVVDGYVSLWYLCGV